MTFGLDTSVVLRLLTGEPSELASHALERYQRGIANGDDFAVSDVVAAETYYALQHHYNKTKEESLAALMMFSGDEGISFSPDFMAAIKTTNIHKAILGLLIACSCQAIHPRVRSRFRARNRFEGSQIPR